ncbi:hypothetical protein [Pedobacter sp. P26]|uniref:hypothetical protein n=1 Tax=Pedobacter sp. P26 TaxID=3423956 RepID=UPI003D67B539
MKIASILPLLLVGILLFSFKKENVANYKVMKAESLFLSSESATKLVSVFKGNYVKTCPDGFSGCGGTSGLVCNGQSNCNPSPVYRPYACPGSQEYGCKTGIQSTLVCLNVKICPGENHPVPCNYGSVSFGCFSGAPIGGGPSCGALINCQTPPN